METARSTLFLIAGSAATVGGGSSVPISLDERSVHAGCEYDQQQRNATTMETIVHKSKTGRDVTVLMATTLDRFFIFCQHNSYATEEEKSVDPIHLWQAQQTISERS